MILFASSAAAAPPRALPDGAHDLDFSFGAWKEHTRRLVKPLTGSTTWVELDGTSVVTKLLGGTANLVEYEGSGPSGRLSLLALRIYDPTTRQWRMNFATPERGELSPTPMVGSFDNGRGEFYSHEDLDGRSIFVRFSVIRVSPTEQRTEQAFSADAGATWETNWINTYTRIDDRELARLRSALPPVTPASRDFDFDASGKLQIRRLVAPLTGSQTWATYEGTHTVYKIWGGRAQLVEIAVQGSTGRLSGFGLRLYNTRAKQWNLNWVSAGAGTFSVPTVGAFARGTGEMFDTEVYEGRAILLRNRFYDLTAKSSKFEQAFSTDGGKTWEPNWIATTTH